MPQTDEDAAPPRQTECLPPGNKLLLTEACSLWITGG